MPDDTVIKVENINKTFKLPHERSNSLKSLVVNFWKRDKGYELQRALQDISFEVKKGDFFGIVGRNGSGKSTLLKLLAGIYVSDSGDIQINGKLTPFIELGVGFSPELTGRENVFLNGSLLGFNRKEMGAMYDDIVEFAELERFMDQKLKNYSSGMQVRLAFSIAIQAQSDILVLDEVLAVGDEAFQNKCMSVFEKYKARKQTIVLVTHDMSTVEKFCNRAVLIQDGKLIKMGNPRLVAQMYRDLNKENYIASHQKGVKYTENIDIKLLDPRTEKPKAVFTQGDHMLVRLGWKRDDVRHAGVAIIKQTGEYIFGPNTLEDRQQIKGNHLDYTVQLNIGPGNYYVKSGLTGEDDSDVLEFVDEGPVFFVEKAKKAHEWGGLAFLPHTWKTTFDKNSKLS